MRLPTSKRGVVAFAVAAAGLFFLTREPQTQAAANIKTVTVAEVAKIVADKSGTVFDANSQKQYESGHVPGARHVSFDEMTRENLAVGTDKKVVFYCWNDMCEASHEAAKAASKLGFSDVSVMRAGIQGWKKAGQPVETGAGAS